MNRDFQPLVGKMFSGIARGLQWCLRSLAVSCFLGLLWGSLSTAYGIGGDLLAPYPVKETRPGKQEAKLSVVDSAGNTIISGYQNLSGGTDDDYLTVKINNNGAIAWRAAFNKVGGSDQVTALAVDSTNNVIVSGFVWNGANFDIHTIKYNGASGAIVWQHTYSGADVGNDIATTVAVDSSDNVYVGGYTQTASGGNDDGLILKYSSSSVTQNNPPLVTVKYNGVVGGHDRFKDLAVSASTMAVTGESWNGTDFDIISVLYDLNGTKLWEKRYSSSGAYPDSGKYVDFDASGNVFVAGYTTFVDGNTRFDLDIYLVKYAAATGSVLWESSYHGNYDDEPSALKVDSQGDAYLSGNTWTQTGRADVFAARYSGADGSVIWQNIFNSGFGNDEVATPKGIAVDETGDVYITGYTVTAGRFDFLTVKYNKANGTILWSKTLDGPDKNNDRPVGIGLTAAGEVLVAGWTDATKPLDGGSALATGGSQVTLTNSGRAWSDDQWFGYAVMITSGPNAGQSSKITTNTADTLTVTPPFTQPVSAGSDYYIYFPNDYDYLVVKYEKGALNPPTGLTAVVADLNSKIRLTWQDNSNNEELFRIERKLGESGIFAEIKTVNPNTTSYEDTGLQPNSYYYYRIRAYNPVNLNSAYSNEARALTVAVTYQTPIWAQPFDGPANSDDFATAIATGSDNRPVVTGYSLGAETGFDYYTLKLDNSTGAPIWSDRYDASFDELDVARAITIDSTNAAIVSGYSSRYNGIDRNTNSVYTIKYSANGPSSPGKGLWDDQYNGPGRIDDRASAIASATDGSGNIVVVGYGKNSQNNDDIYVIKYNHAGTRAWAAIPYDGGSNDQPSSVAFDKDGNVFVAGYTYLGTNADYFVAKYCGSVTSSCGGKNPGEIIWQDTFNGPGSGNDYARSIAIDPTGNAFVTGSVIDATGHRTFMTIKYDGSNSSLQRRVWERSYHGPGQGDDYAVSVKVDPISGDGALDGNIIVAGASSTVTGDHAFYLLRYNLDGGLVWERKLQKSDSDDYPVDMAIDTSGYLYVTGNMLSNGTSDILSVVYDFEGTLLGATTFNGAANSFDEASSIAVNDIGEAFIAGYTTNSTGNADYLVYKSKFDQYQVLVPTPFNVTADEDYRKVQLSWRENTLGSSYRLERTMGPVTGQSDWTLIGTPGAGVTAYTDNDPLLMAGTQYCYRLDAVSGSFSSRKLTSCVTTTLPAPVLNPVQVVSSSQIDLSWGNIPGNSGYQIERKMGIGGNWAIIGTTLADLTTYSNNGLTSGQYYYYRVRAKNISGYSVAGTEQGAITKPAAPVLAAVSNLTSSGLTLTWSDVAGENGYRIERLDSGSWIPILPNIGANVITWSDSGRLSNTNYGYRVLAYNDSGDSVYSNIQSVLTQLPTPVLTSISVDALNKNVNLGWSDISGETGYVIEEASCRSTARAYDCAHDLTSIYLWTPWSVVGSVGANVTSYPRTGLTADTHYQYRVRATTAVNTSAPSNTLAAETWLTPPIIAISPSSETALAVSWNENLGISRYDVERKLGTGGSWQTIASGLNWDTLSYLSSNLELHTLYCYRVRGYSDQVTAPPAVYSVDDGITNCMTTPLVAPVVNPLTGVTASTLTVSWNNVTGNTGYEILRDSALRYNPEDGANASYYRGMWSIIATVGQDVTSYPDKNLTPGLTYRYMVRDRFPGGVSANSNWVYTTTIPATPIVNGPVAVSSSQIDVSWYENIGESNYQLQWKAGSGGTWSAPITIAQNIAKYSHTGLTSGITYYYRVNALNSNGESAYSGEVSAAPLLNAPVLNPLSGITANSVTLSWGNLTGNTGYRIERKIGDSITWSQIATVGANITSYPNNGLTAGTTYTYRVSAASTGGYSQPSNEQVTVTTPAASVVTGYVSSSDRIELSWPVVPGATDYRLMQKLGLNGNYNQLWTTAIAYSSSYCGSTYPSVKCPTASGNPVSHSVTGLLPDSTYCYQVISHNVTGGDSALSREICFKTMAVGTPILTVRPVTSTKVELTWGAVSGAVPLDGYAIEMKLPTGGYTRVATVPATQTSYVDGKRQPNASYTYRIRGYQRVGDDFNSGYNGTLWTPRGIIKNSAGGTVSDVIIPPVDIVDAVNGSARVKWVDKEVDLHTVSPGGGTGASYNSSRIYVSNPGFLAGEFDLVVGYRLPEGAGNPAQYQVYSRLNVNIGTTGGGTDTIYVERNGSGGSGAYTSSMTLAGVGSSTNLVTQDISGRLQISKKADRITTSVWSGNTWATIQDQPYSESGAANYLAISQLVQRNEVKTLHALIDNFEVLHYLTGYSNDAPVTTPAYLDVCQ